MKLVKSEAAAIIEPETAAAAAVIWLHGLGADGFDFVPIVPELKLPTTLAVRFLFPHAASRPVTLNGGMKMRAWYDLAGLTRSDGQDEGGIRASAKLIDQLIDGQVSAGVPRGRIALAGFSQGGAIALHAGLRQVEALAGIMALSTYVPLEASVQGELTSAGRRTPVLMCHGRQDQVLAVDMGAHSRDLLRSLGVAVEWHEYSMGHAVCPEEIGVISAWLRSRLS